MFTLSIYFATNPEWGLKKGDKVAIYMETRAEWFILAHAAFRAGLTVVTVYASLGEEAVTDALM